VIGLDPNRIVELYNKKVNDEKDLNFLLSKKDKKVFNHSGIVYPFEKPKNEEETLDILHKMEINLAAYALKYFDPLPNASVVLDAGCGGGGTSFMIHETFHCQIEGFDLSTGQIELAKKVRQQLGYSNCYFSVGNMLNLPREKQFYDLVFSCESSEHITDLDAMYREFQRVLKPLGHLIIIAWCSVNSPIGKILKSKVDEHYLTDIHTVEEYVTSAKRHGWEITNEVDLTSLTLPYWRLRNSSTHRTGSETLFIEGYSTGNLQYFLWKLRNIDSRNG
jgi:geranyl diphosphate 2-C-methyltransferase